MKLKEAVCPTRFMVSLQLHVVPHLNKLLKESKTDEEKVVNNIYADATATAIRNAIIMLARSYCECHFCNEVAEGLREIYKAHEYDHIVSLGEVIKEHLYEEIESVE